MRARRINWLALALVVSLAVNLMVAGAVAARWYAGPDRMPRMTQSQLIPRLFFRELDRARRAALLSELKPLDQRVRDGRQAVKAQVMALADALDAEPYDAARTTAAVAGFTARSEALFATGSEAALALIARLTPVERRLMAAQLRARETNGRPAAEKKPGAN